MPGVRAQTSIQADNCNGRLHGSVVRTTGEPVAGIEVVLDPWGVDFDHVLPRTRTSSRGEYNFEHVCPGEYTVFVEDKGNGYPDGYHATFLHLQGGGNLHVKLNSAQPDVEFQVVMPPLPALLEVRAVNSRSGVAVQGVIVGIRLKGKPKRASENVILHSDPTVPIPPDSDVIVHIKSNHFHEWKETAGRGKSYRLSPGTRVTLDVSLQPRLGQKD